VSEIPLPMILARWTRSHLSRLCDSLCACSAAKRSLEDNDHLVQAPSFDVNRHPVGDAAAGAPPVIYLVGGDIADADAERYA
jgi:hypothetical protein